MKDEYLLTIGCKGYISKADATNVNPSYLVRGSQNVVINDNERVESRSGTEIFGATTTETYPVKSEFSWKHNSGGSTTLQTEILLREVNGTLYFYSEESSAFEVLLTGLSTTKPVRFATVWDTTALEDVLLFVNNSTSLYKWSGGMGTIAGDSSVASGAITIQETIASQRFWTTTGSIRIKDSGGTWRETAYTSQTGSVFTVSSDLSSYTFSAGALVIQKVDTVSKTMQSGYTDLTYDTIKTLNNQVWLGSNTSRVIYVSKGTDYSNYAYSATRVAGEGAVVTMDDVTIGMEVPDSLASENKMIVYSGKDRIYQVSFEINAGADATREVPRVKPLLVSEGQGAIDQEFICKIKGAIVWVSNNKELVELGQVENLPSPQALPISDPVKPDFTDASFTNGNVKFWRNSIFVTDGTNTKMFIYDLSKRFWQPPQTIGVRLMSIYNNLLYGHSNSVDETYKLFTGLSDNGNPISFKAHFAYQNGGLRYKLKNFDKFFTELYIQGNTKVTVSLLYEWKGAKGITTYELDGSQREFLFTPNNSASLGVNPLGTNPLGGQLEAGELTPKYRRFKPIVPKDCFEFQARFECDASDFAFQILAFGANIMLSKNLPVNITK